MSIILICVRTPKSMHMLKLAARRTGIEHLIQFAATENQILARLAIAPASMILVDPTVISPGQTGFIRKVLELSPLSKLVFLGTSLSTTINGNIQVNPIDPVTVLIAIADLINIPIVPRTARVDQALLSTRQLQVLRGIVDGKSNSQIGQELFLTEETVKTHAHNLYQKLGVADRTQAVVVAFRAGLVR